MIRTAQHLYELLQKQNGGRVVRTRLHCCICDVFHVERDCSVGRDIQRCFGSSSGCAIHEHLLCGDDGKYSKNACVCARAAQTLSSILRNIDPFTAAEKVSFSVVATAKNPVHTALIPIAAKLACWAASVASTS